jgi:hypothetical protein
VSALSSLGSDSADAWQNTSPQYHDKNQNAANLTELGSGTPILESAINNSESDLNFESSSNIVLSAAQQQILGQISTQIK